MEPVKVFTIKTISTTLKIGEKKIKIKTDKNGYIKINGYLIFERGIVRYLFEYIIYCIVYNLNILDFNTTPILTLKKIYFNYELINKSEVSNGKLIRVFNN